MSSIIDIKNKKLLFKRDDYLYKLEYFKTVNMTIDTLCYKNDKFILSYTFILLFEKIAVIF